MNKKASPTSSPLIHFTFGPACQPVGILKQVIAAAPWCRINLSHQQPEALGQIFALLRETARSQNLPLHIACDLRGRKLRTGPLPAGQKSVPLCAGQTIRLRGLPVDQEQPFTDSTLSINHPELHKILRPGHRVLLDDGALQLRVEKVQDKYIHGVLVNDATLQPRVGCNLPDTVLDLPALTKRDLQDLDALQGLQADALYLSYCEHGDDLALLRRELQQRDMKAQLIAKIESPVALQNLSNIAAQADMLCLARGDLGVMLPWAQLPQVQADFARRAQKLGRPWILAGEIALSLLHRPQPSRGELSDLYLACQQGAAGLILSDESALGHAPARSLPLVARLLDDFCVQQS